MKSGKYHCTIKDGDKIVVAFDFVIEEGDRREVIAAEALSKIGNLIKGRLIPQINPNSPNPNEDLLEAYGYYLIID